jgi:hypothetical protein
VLRKAVVRSSKAGMHTARKSPDHANTAAAASTTQTARRPERSWGRRRGQLGGRDAKPVPPRAKTAWLAAAGDRVDALVSKLQAALEVHRETVIAGP